MRALRLGVLAGLAMVLISAGAYLVVAATTPKIALGLAYAFLPILAILCIIALGAVFFFGDWLLDQIPFFKREPDDKDRGFSSNRRDPLSIAIPFALLAVFAVAAAALQATARADSFEADSRAEFWRVATGRYDRAAERLAKPFEPRAVASATHKVAQIVADEASRQGVSPHVALKLAWIESRLKCGAVGPATRHGRARGVLQVLPSSAESLAPGSSRRLTDCATGARVGVAHMADCAQAGATSPELIARCHVGGKRALRGRLNARAERYARQYVRLFHAAPVFAVPDRSGWLARGSVSVASLIGG